MFVQRRITGFAGCFCDFFFLRLNRFPSGFVPYKRKIVNYVGYYGNCRIRGDDFSCSLVCPETDTDGAADKPVGLRNFYRLRRDARIEMADYYLERLSGNDSDVSFVLDEKKDQ